MGKTAAIILAAGQGSRMRSDLAKVLHSLAGLEMVNHVVRSVRLASFDPVVVVIGYQGEKVQAVLEGVTLVEQKNQLGTGHAVDQCRETLQNFKGPVLVTYGDTPLLRPETFDKLIDYHRKHGAAATILTACFEDPSGYGRILRNEADQVVGVREHKDASPAELSIKEINTGTYCFDSELLFQYLTQITPHNAQAEYYLPDVLPLMLAAGQKVAGYILEDPRESMGINDRAQLSQAEAILRDRICCYWQEQGVTIVDPKTTWIELDCQIGQDTVIYPGSFIQKGSVIGEHCIIGPNCRLQGAKIGSGVTMEQTVAVDVIVESGQSVMPFSVLTK